MLLLRITLNTAPWWVKGEKGYCEEELKKEMEAAKDRDERAIEWLEAMVLEKARRKTI